MPKEVVGSICGALCMGRWHSTCHGLYFIAARAEALSEKASAAACAHSICLQTWAQHYSQDALDKSGSPDKVMNEPHIEQVLWKMMHEEPVELVSRFVRQAGFLVWNCDFVKFLSLYSWDVISFLVT